MDIKEFISNFANQFEETDKVAFSAQTRFRDLEEWSSLVALSVIAMADEEYGVQLKGDDMRNAQTIDDLYNTVKAKEV